MLKWVENDYVSGVLLSSEAKESVKWVSFLYEKFNYGSKLWNCIKYFFLIKNWKHWIWAYTHILSFSLSFPFSACILVPVFLFSFEYKDYAWSQLSQFRFKLWYLEQVFNLCVHFPHLQNVDKNSIHFKGC